MKISNNVNFGYCSLFQITPTEVKWVYRAFGLCTLLWTTLLGFYSTQIPVPLQLNVFKALACGTALTYAGAQFFGITLPTTTINATTAPILRDSIQSLTPNQIVTPVSNIIIKPNN